MTNQEKVAAIRFFMDIYGFNKKDAEQEAKSLTKAIELGNDREFVAAQNIATSKENAS